MQEQRLLLVLKPYEDQLTSITAEILRLETSAKEYESKISTL